VANCGRRDLADAENSSTWWTRGPHGSRERPHERPHRRSTAITTISAAVPAALIELRTLGRTLQRRAADVLAYFDRPGTSNGPTEAINGRLEHLRGSALGFRNLTNYIARSLLESGGFRPRLHPRFG
jgi:transposase